MDLEREHFDKIIAYAMDKRIVNLFNMNVKTITYDGVYNPGYSGVISLYCFSGKDLYTAPWLLGEVAFFDTYMAITKTVDTWKIKVFTNYTPEVKAAYDSFLESKRIEESRTAADDVPNVQTSQSQNGDPGRESGSGIRVSSGRSDEDSSSQGKDAQVRSDAEGSVFEAHQLDLFGETA